MATVSVGSVLAALEISGDFQAYEAGELTAREFYARWRVHPDHFDWIRVDLSEIPSSRSGGS
jgi:hypothetical protein